MSTLPEGSKGSRPGLRVAVTAALLGVAGCFLAAFSFAGESVEASETPALKETSSR